MNISPLNIKKHHKVVFFTGAGMSAESGIATFRGKGGRWSQYNWEEVACEEAFGRTPEIVLEYHQSRRDEVAACDPNIGHRIIAALERRHDTIAVVTQNIDGLHEFAGSTNIAELHGNMWRFRCPKDYRKYKVDRHKEPPRFCECGALLRPDIIWFGDNLDGAVVDHALQLLANCDTLISIGTSASVWPAAGYPAVAKQNGAICIEINPEASGMDGLYAHFYEGKAGEILPLLFPDEAKFVIDNFGDQHEESPGAGI